MLRAINRPITPADVEDREMPQRSGLARSARPPHQPQLIGPGTHTSWNTQTRGPQPPLDPADRRLSPSAQSNHPLMLQPSRPTRGRETCGTPNPPDPTPPRCPGIMPVQHSALPSHRGNASQCRSADPIDAECSPLPATGNANTAFNGSDFCILVRAAMHIQRPPDGSAQSPRKINPVLRAKPSARRSPLPLDAAAAEPP